MKEHRAGIRKMRRCQHCLQQNKDAKANRARSRKAEYDLECRATHLPPEACIISHPCRRLPSPASHYNIGVIQV